MLNVVGEVLHFPGSFKVSGPNLVTFLKYTPTFEWCVVRGGSENRHQKDIMCLKEIGLCAWNLLTVSQ